MTVYKQFQVINMNIKTKGCLLFNEADNFICVQIVIFLN